MRRKQQPVRGLAVARFLAAAVPFVLVPPALYVALLPLADTTVSAGRLVLTGAAGALGIGLPALALHVAEVRAGRRAAIAFLTFAAAAAAVGIAAGARVLDALGVALVLQVAAYGYGRWLVRWGGAGAVPTSLAAGWGVLVICALALGHLGFLTRPAVAAIGMVGIVLAAAGLARRARSSSPPASASVPPRSDPCVPVAWWWGVVVLLLVGFVGAAAPEVRHDALTAHLPIAREFAARGRIVEIRHNAASYFQLNADLLYAIGMLLLPGEGLPKFLHFGAGVAATLIVYRIGARLWDARVGLAAAAVVAGTPLWWWVGGTAYTDLWVALFAVAALDGLLDYAGRPGPARAALIGLLAGAAVGSKITGVATVAPMVAVFAAWSLALRRRRRALAIAALVVSAAASGGYWYARAFALTGDPVYPLSRLIVSIGAPRAAPLGPMTFGAGRAPQDLLLLPWRTTRHPEWFVEDGWLGIAYLVALPPAMIAAVRGRIPRWFVVMFLAAGLFWAWTAQYLRYLLPALPLAALLAAAGTLGQGGPAHRGWVAVLVLCLALGAGAWAAPGPPNFPWPVAARTMSRERYLERYVPGYSVASFARRTLPERARILGVGEDRAWLYDHFFVPISWYGRRYHRQLRTEVLSARTGADVEHVLARAGFTHLVLYPDYPLAGLGEVAGSWVARSALWKEGPRLEYADAGRYLLTVASPLGPRVPGQTLLDQAQVSRAAQAPIIYAISIAQEALYGLEVEIRSTGDGADADLIVRWTDPAGRPIGTGVERHVRAGPAWARIRLAGTAPRGAASAQIEIKPAPARAVEVGALKFFELR
ncbi:MAG: glycosyltransferase family 39 protein [Armatimonadota bacterium]|nr:glycosyltransferase family 39 protein [Armatimonadota bacterium]